MRFDLSCASHLYCYTIVMSVCNCSVLCAVQGVSVCCVICVCGVTIDVFSTTLSTTLPFLYPLELKQLLAAEGVEPASLDTPTSSLHTPTSLLDTPITPPYAPETAERSPNVAVFKVGGPPTYVVPGGGPCGPAPTAPSTSPY